MAIYTYMGYDAVAVGSYDLQAGISLLKETAVSGFPWLSANIVDLSGKPIFKPYKIIRKNGQSVGVIGLTGELTSLPEGTRMAGWDTVLPPLLRTLSASCDIVVVLSSLADSENRQIMDKNAEVNILFSADRRLGNVQPIVLKKTLTTQVLSQGKYIGRLDIDWQKDRAWLRDFNQEIATLQSQLSRINRRIQRTEILQRSSGSQNAADPLLQQRELINQRLAALSSEQKTAVAEGEVSNTFSHSFIALSKDLQESSEVNDMLAELQKKIAMSYTEHPESGGESANCGQKEKRW